MVDNLGDIGVMWRLARQLTQEKGWKIRLWVDHLDSLHALSPDVDPSLDIQFTQNIEVHRWPGAWQPITPHQIVVAGFSCELPDDYLQQLASQTNAVWLQLEYLSAEDWVDSFHGLHSKRNDTLKPTFFFPGFNEQTGGLLREQHLLELRENWITTRQRDDWFARRNIMIPEAANLVSVFTYPHAPLHLLINQLRQTNQRFHLLLPSGQTLPPSSMDEQVTWQAIEFLTQPDYDKLLWSCDLNLVRGEDSFIRAVWAGKPMLWQIYQQKDGAHHPKLDAWLKLVDLPDPIGQAMHEWADGKLTADLTAFLTGPGWREWQK